MLVYAKSDRTTYLYTDDEVVQGSIKADYVDFLATLPTTTVITVAFTLPNGTVTSPQPATLFAQGVENMNVWRYVFPANVTQYAGKLKIQFFATANGVTVAYDLVECTIAAGVPYVIPSTSVSWDSILNIYNEMLKYVYGGHKAVEDGETYEIQNHTTYYPKDENTGTIELTNLTANTVFYIRFFNVGTGTWTIKYNVSSATNPTLVNRGNITASITGGYVTITSTAKTLAEYTMKWDAENAVFYLDGIATFSTYDSVFTGTTHFENAVVTGDTVLHQVEVQDSITVPTPSDNTEATPKGYVLGLHGVPTFTPLDDGTYSLSALGLTDTANAFVEAEYFTVFAPATATNGTFNEDEMEILNDSTSNYFIFGGQEYHFDTMTVDQSVKNYVNNEETHQIAVNVNGSWLKTTYSVR